ncbi:hypothetical protein QBC37DRAFT_483223 [Rhypophila decipiens]|uniref:Uncharacterized protein n=1 Tax=Rhypophila decipiens TaxID=261697 RepID=A0AAN6Y634_9PEZI|nr:hypothetical protein QBC37DRAFT_483223 [Rhypophila decipiens]
MEAQQPKYTSPKGMWVTKLILRIFSIIFCITLAALGGAMANTHIVDAIIFLIMGPPVFAALAWDITEGICILARGGHRGIHPGACVGVDLILWLGLTACTTLLGILGVGSGFFAYYYDYYDSLYFDDAYGDGGVYNDLVNKGRAVLGLGATLILIHFVLFVMACYETNERNRLPATTYVVYTTGPAPAGAQTTSMYGIPAGAVQQPQQPQQVYYQSAQPMPGAQTPMYYTYAQPGQQQQQVQQQQQPQQYQQQPMPVSPTSASTTPQSFAAQPNVAHPPPIYTGKNATENKTELPS